MSKRKEIDRLQNENANLRNRLDNLQDHMKQEYANDPKLFIKKVILGRIDNSIRELNCGYTENKGFFDMLRLLIEIDRIDFTDANTVPVIGSQEDCEK